MVIRLMFKKVIVFSDFFKKKNYESNENVCNESRYLINIKVNYVGNFEFSVEEFSDGLYLCKCN